MFSSSLDYSFLNARFRYPEHELTVQQCVNHSREQKPSNSGIVQIDSDDDEFEDASETFNMDDYFVDSESSKKIEPLSKYEQEKTNEQLRDCLLFQFQSISRTTSSAVLIFANNSL